jgi:hypothetical protein
MDADAVSSERHQSLGVRGYFGRGIDTILLLLRRSLENYESERVRDRQLITKCSKLTRAKKDLQYVLRINDLLISD